MPLVRTSLTARFELSGVLVESTAGTVYVAKERQTGLLRCLHFVGWRYTQPSQRQRYVYQLKATAVISHPNLLPIVEISEGDDGLLVVYAYESCQPLSNLLADSALSLEEAMAYALQLADVLETTSRQGLMHGYLDPTSVLVTPKGLVKLFGFGSARLRALEDEAQLRSGDASPGEAAAIEHTQLRRVAYQAPECLRDLQPDARSEVFAVGCLFYEMISGRRAFARKSSALTAKAVMEQPPPAISEVAVAVPQEVSHVLRKCLRKEPDRRYQHLLDLKIDLQNYRDELAFSNIIRQVEDGATKWRWRLVAAVVVIWASIYLGVPRLLLRSIAPKASPVAALVPVTTGNTLSTDPFVSADGKWLLFASDRDGKSLDIYLQSLGGGTASQEPRRLTLDDADDREPTLSPDGKRVVFRSDRLAGGLYSVPTDGSESPRWIANQGRRPRFSPDGSHIAFWARTLGSEEVGSIYVMPAAGGAPRQLADDFYTALLPVWSSDSRFLLFQGARRKGDALEFWAIPLDGGAAQNVGAHRVMRRWFIRQASPDAWVNDTLYFTGTANGVTSLWKLPLPHTTLRVQGDSVPLFQTAAASQPKGRERAHVTQVVAAKATVSADGRVFFARMQDSVQLWSAPVDANKGHMKGDVGRLFATEGAAVRPSFSRDGKLLAYTCEKDGGVQNVWLRNMVTGQEERVTDNTHDFFTPSGILSADGMWLAFTRYDKGKTVTYFRSSIPAGMPGSVPETHLCDNCETPRDWSPDSRDLLYVRSSGSYTVGTVERGSGVKTVLVRSESSPLLSPRFSPDGRWIAFHALVNPDLRQVFAQAISGTSSASERAWVPISSGLILDRGAQWSPDGNLLYYMSERGGRRNIYGQLLDPKTKHPRGEPFVVYGNRATQRSLLNVPRGLAEMVVLADRIVFTMGEYTGNIYEAQLAD